MKMRWLGLLSVILGSIFWGSSGIMTDLMLNRYQISPVWLVGISFISSGILLLAIYGLLRHKVVFAIWHDQAIRKRLISFGIIGMMPTQLLYFIAINYSNAATATILQFTGPVFIIIYLAFKNRRLPSRIDTFSVLLAILGTALLAIRGNFASLAISILGLLFGLGSGISSAIYTILPSQLLKKYEAMLLCGWGFLLGGLPLSPFLIIDRPPIYNYHFDLDLLFVIIIGTMLAYLFYVVSINYLNPTVSGVLASFEPLTATFLSVLLLNLKLNGAEILGIGLILLMAIIQSFPQNNQ